MDFSAHCPRNVNSKNLLREGSNSIFYPPTYPNIPKMSQPRHKAYIARKMRKSEKLLLKLILKSSGFVTTIIDLILYM